MKHALTQTIENVASNPKTAQTVATATAGLGAAEIADLIKDGLGIVAVVTGIVLSITLIIKNRYEYRVARERREEEIREREAQGLPTRRESDLY